MLFRKSNETATWHWRTECSAWPGEEADNWIGLPRGGHLCKECEALDLQSALKRLEAEEATARLLADPPAPAVAHKAADKTIKRKSA